MPVDWYFVPDDRPHIKFPHSFMSRIYERDEEPQPELGERYSPVPWRGGNVPATVATRGVCGSIDRWQDGTPISEPLPDAWPGTNVAKCCGQPNPRAVGGIAFGHFDVTPVNREKGGFAFGGEFSGTSIDVCPCITIGVMPWALNVRWIFRAGTCDQLNEVNVVLHPGVDFPTVPGFDWLYSSDLMALDTLQFTMIVACNTVSGNFELILRSTFPGIDVSGANLTTVQEGPLVLYGDISIPFPWMCAGTDYSVSITAID